MISKILHIDDELAPTSVSSSTSQLDPKTI